MSKRPNLRELQKDVKIGANWCPHCSTGDHKLTLYEDLDDKTALYFIGLCSTTGKKVQLKANVVNTRLE